MAGVHRGMMGAEKNEGFIKTVRENWQALLYYARYLKPYWKHHLIVILFSQFVVCLGLVNPYLTKIVIDDAYVNKDLRLFILTAVAGAVVFAVSGVFSSVASYYSFIIKRNVSFDINRDSVAHLYSLNLKFFKDTSAGENLYKINYDIERITALITDTALEILNMIPTFILTIAIVVFLDWKMGLISLVLGLLFYVSAGYYAKKKRDVMLELIKQRQEVFKRLNEALRNIHIIKASGKEAEETQIHVDKTEEVMKSFLENREAEIKSDFASSVINNSILASITFYGGYQIIAGNMTLGTLTAIMVYLSRIVNFHMKSANIIQRITVDLISCQRVKAITDNVPEARGGRTPENIGDVEFRNVSFKYIEDTPVLQNFSMRVRPGEWIGLAGFSGSGKTTTIDMMLGLYDPAGGEVLVGGVPYREVDFNFVRRNTGIVLQKPYLWNDSILANITYFSRGSPQEIDQVIDDVRLREVIQQQPNGLETNVGEAACRLSEGQKQRMALARALLRKPKVLILDEALSFVDNETSAEILRNLKRDYAGMTVLSVSHNPNILAQTDRVYFMKKDGSVIEGTHQQLSMRDDYQELLKLKAEQVH